MIKSITAILIAAALLFGLGLFEWIYVENTFEGFHEELKTLYDKTESDEANGEDAKAVQAAWERRKENLHIWIPHNDVMRIDDYMAETVRYIAENERELALAKLEILLHLTECLPDTYRPALENIL